MTNNKKKRNNKKKAPTPTSALDELMKKLTLASSTYSEMTCYHGSSIEKFSLDSDYEKTIRDYLSTQLIFIKGYGAIWETNMELGMKFDTDHLEFMKDVKFGRFVFAKCVSIHLNNNLEDNVSAKSVVQALLFMGFRIKYCWIPESLLLSGVLVETDNTEKLFKYCRDIKTDDRTIINIISRETKAFCGCMKPKKTEAKNMKKMGRCSGCDKLFPKEQMLKCSGCCRSHYYHSKECQINHWPFHKKICGLAVDRSSKELVSIAERNEIYRNLVSRFDQQELEERK
jgi:hypothetical protein